MESNINEITINGKKYVEANGSNSFSPITDDEGLTYCIVRTYSAGVFAGYFDTDEVEKIGVVKNARRIWYWDGAASLSQLAMEGTKAPANCKFSVVTPEVYLTEIIEVLPCTRTAQKSIEGVPVWRA